jgi:hypothetical protein|tara:strand:- start:2655 stop:2936 length:282 start_codon:yes stop_codon:yes gene_type:complete
MQDFQLLLLTEFIYPTSCLLDFIITKNLYFLSFAHLLVEFAEGFGITILISGLILSGFTVTSVVLRFSQNSKTGNFKLISPYTLLCSYLFKNM